MSELPNFPGDNQEQDQKVATVWNEETLSSESIKQLVADLIPSEKERNGRNFGMHIIDGSDAHANIGRRIEWQVFDEFFGNDIDVMRQEYEPYDSASVFIVALDYEASMPMGVIRMIKPSPVGLKSMNDLLNPDQEGWYRDGDTLAGRMEEMGATEDKLADLATIAVAPEYRTGHSAMGTSAALYSTYVQWSLESGFNHTIIVTDKNVYGMIQEWGEPLTIFEGADWANYLDSSASVPVYLELGEGLRKVAEHDKKLNSQGQNVDIHGLYTRGKGLDQLFVLPKFEIPVQYLE